MVKKIWLIMTMILISLVGVNAVVTLDGNNILQIECLASESINLNQATDYASAVGINITMQNSCSFIAVQEVDTNTILDIYVDGYTPNTIIDFNTTNFYVSTTTGFPQGVATIHFGNNFDHFEPYAFSIARIESFDGNGITNLTAYIDMSGGSTFANLQFSNFGTLHLFSDELVPEFLAEPILYNHLYNDEVVVVQFQVTQPAQISTITAITNLYQEGVGLVDSRNSTGLTPDGLATIQHTFTLLEKSIYYVEIDLIPEGYEYQSNNLDIFPNGNLFFFNTTNNLVPIFTFQELYYVPLRQLTQWELPINNDTTGKFNALAQGFIGNNETLKNASFYFANYGVTPLYDINVNLYQGVFDIGFGGYDCQFITNHSLATSLSQGFIDRNLINDTQPVLINFNMSPYLLEQGMVYCLAFSSNSQDIINPNDIIVYVEDTDPYNLISGEFLKTDYDLFVSAGTYDMAGIIYSAVEEVIVLGCTNPLANNYNPLATLDDGSCIVIEEDTRGFLQRTMEDTGNGFAGFFNALFPSVSSWLIVLTIIALCLLIAGVFAKGVQNKFK